MAIPEPFYSEAAEIIRQWMGHVAPESSEGALREAFIAGVQFGESFHGFDGAEPCAPEALQRWLATREPDASGGETT